VPRYFTLDQARQLLTAADRLLRQTIEHLKTMGILGKTGKIISRRKIAPQPETTNA